MTEAGSAERRIYELAARHGIEAERLPIGDWADQVTRLSLVLISRRSFLILSKLKSAAVGAADQYTVPRLIATSAIRCG